MRERIKKAKQFVQTHKYQVTFGVGVVIGGVLVGKHYEVIRRDLEFNLDRCQTVLLEDMQINVTKEELQLLLEGSTSALVSRAEEDLGGSIFITLK